MNNKENQRKNRRKKSKFRKIYLISVASALLLVFIFFGIFYDIMDNYEKSQPISGAKAFAESVTEADLDELCEKIAAEISSPYEDRDEIKKEIDRLLSSSALVCSKDRALYTSEAPVFTVSCGEIPIHRIYLSEGRELKYGFKAWKTSSAETVLTANDLYQSTAYVYVPGDAELYINGILAESEPDGTFPYKYAVGWEKDTLRHDLYKLDLICEAEFSVMFNGIECDQQKEDGNTYFLYPDVFLTDYLITAPVGASVEVNGIPLSEANRTSSPAEKYESHKLEENRSDIPASVSYLVKGLTVPPKVSGELDGISLSFSSDGSSCSAPYPAELQYSLKLRVPKGCEVMSGGISLTESDITGSENESLELFSYTQVLPSYDIYEIPRLFFRPDDVKISYNGAPLEYELTENGNELTYTASYPKTESEDAKTLSLSFLKAYFHYTSSGYNNTQQNLAALLTYIPAGCELYKTMVLSENSFTWVTPAISVSYNTLEVTKVLEYPESLTLCEVAIDITQSYYANVKREYKGIIRLVVTSDGKAVGMEIDADMNP